MSPSTVQVATAVAEVSTEGAAEIVSVSCVDVLTTGVVVLSLVDVANAWGMIAEKTAATTRSSRNAMSEAGSERRLVVVLS